MSIMEDLLANQEQLQTALEQLYRNFKKDPSDRKTSVYIRKRLQTLDAYWEEFQANHMKLCEFDDRGYTYFSENMYHKTMKFYHQVKESIQQYKGSESDTKRDQSSLHPSVQVSDFQNQDTSDKKYLECEQEKPINDHSEGTSTTIGKLVSQGNPSKLEEMYRKQKSNFKALSRAIANIDLESISERWEYQDALKTIEARWTAIDALHWEIDSESFEEDAEYEQNYSRYEKLYISVKKSINTSMWSVTHTEDCTPKTDIPIFSGNFHKWISFKDLFTEAIHNKKSISAAQKMQCLKSKLRGEAERLIQHLKISSNNYQICWDILNHRYNNNKLIFNSHISILLSLHTMQQQSFSQIKNIFDTTNECLNAIKSLGVDISTWDPLIVYLLTQKLDSQTHTEYNDFIQNPKELPTLADFLGFLENKYISLESSQRKPGSKPITYNEKHGSLQPKKKPFYNKMHNSSTSKYETNTPFMPSSTIKSFATKTQICPLCKDSHGLFHCKTFLDANPETKRNTIKKLNLCINCLYDHKDKACFSQAKCRVCLGHHNTLLHDTFQTTAESSNTSASKRATLLHEQRKNVTHISNQNMTETLLATALVQIKGTNKNFIMRALIDQGSQVSLISENAAQLLGIPRKAFSGAIFGVGSNPNNCKGMLNITASSLHTNFTFQADVLIMKNLLHNLPNQTFVKPSWKYLQTIQLADPEFNISRPVDLLLGADVYAEIIMAGIIKENERQPVAQQTQLGWILCGNVQSYQCNVVLNNIEDIQRFWTIEDITENDTSMSLEDQQCIQQYNSETFRKDDGRYVVRLPLKPGIDKNLGKSKQKAVSQFYSLERKFSTNKQIADHYKSFIQEYIVLGHMRECAREYLPDCILPHHCVLRAESTTTSLRVVFNASAKTSTGFSLNDLMYRGPNLQQDLFKLILRWRQYEYAFTADIEKMFRQIICNEKDQRYQKIIWRQSPDEVLQEYKLTTVTYGTKAAPFLAMMTLKRLAEDERSRYPTASRVLEQDFYMDDVLSGHHSLEDTIQLKTDLTNLLKSGGFHLRKWSSNKPEILDDNVNTNQQAFEFRHQESTKTLGLRWQPYEDQFTYQIKIDTATTPATKRSLLSEISKLFDPLGWLSPLSTKLKTLFQDVWKMNLNWDDHLPENINEEWHNMKKDLQNIDQIKVQRWLETHNCDNIELHGFCDASMKAYACVIYCRIIQSDNHGKRIPITIVAGKTRLVPVNKTVSLPRLELSAASLLSKLMKTVQNCLSSNHNITVYGWSDSTAVLGWLQGEPNRWKPFVANRVKQITEIIPITSWNYVKSAENPADCASRGISVNQLKLHHLWWHGPEWLANTKIIKKGTLSIYNTTEEMKKSAKINVTLQRQDDDIALNILYKYSNFNRATRVLAWTLRAISPIKTKLNYLTINEMKRAEYILIKQAQQVAFTEDITSFRKNNRVDSNSKLHGLNPFLDQDGLLRVGGRLRNAKIPNNMKHPIIIPHSSHLTNLLIDQGHQMTYHGGARLTLAWLRQKYWILGGNQAVKKHLRSCVKCRRHDPVKQDQLMGDLPASRINLTRPFYHTGVDFTGFVEIKTNKGRGVKTTKGYIAVFVCMATKAVHLELVSDLSSSSFLAALRRMAARRGIPAHVYSDNGTNFIGANRKLNEGFIDLLDSDFFNTITDMKITWHFNAPLWPSAGGLWEAAVKSLKYHLKRVIGEQKLTYEEYSTLLAQLEACLNSRPLCALSEDPDDLDYLTPSHFLSSGPTLTISETESDLRTRWQLTQKIFSDIWKRWQTEYLVQLSSRSKWRQARENLKIDDIVIIHDSNLPAGKWALGRVIDTHAGKDSYVRVVTIQTKNGKIKRPITKLSLLPTNFTSNENAENENFEKSYSKQSKTPSNKCNLLYTIIMLLMFIISPTVADYKISTFNNNQSLYFDKKMNLHLEREEWKLIIYCDMGPYWRATELFEKYIKYLENICAADHVSQCNVVTLQLRHGLTELGHYNNLLLEQQNKQTIRKRRGLINGVGYVAHSLFGILDEDFAEKYQKDIDLIRSNENHLALLWRNQTSVVEAELNIIKRVENAMDKQHKLLHQHMMKLDSGVNTLKQQIETTDRKNDFTLSTVIANNILNNLKIIQTAVVETLTNIYPDKFNMHLLTPEQLRNELRIISGQLSKDLTIPINIIAETDLKRIFHLLKVKARNTKQYLIFEVRIPLVSRDSYEVFELIAIPRQVGEDMVTIVPVSSVLAINIQKDTYIPMSSNELQKCLSYDLKEFICRLQHPIHHMTSDENLCLKDHTSDRCQVETKICRDMWIELNVINSYFYFCCGQCPIRIICEDNITIERLCKSGIITISEGCIVKGETFTIYSHKMLSNSMKTEASMANFEIPAINNIINLSLPLINNTDESDETIERQQSLDLIEEDIKKIKTSESPLLSDGITSHDIHHYVVIYAIVAVVGLFGIIYLWRRTVKKGVRLDQSEPCVHYSTAAERPAVPPRSQNHPSNSHRVDRTTSPVIRKHFSLT